MARYVGEHAMKPTKKQKKKGNAIYNILIIICILVFLGSGGYLAMQLYDYFDASNTRNNLEKMVGEVDKETKLIDYSKLYQENNDFVGWVKINGTKIDYPVVKYTDNEKYLSTDFYGKPHRLGTVFADSRATLTKEYQSDNVVLYGHSAKDGSYFNDVRNYNKLDYYKKHPFVTFNTMYDNSDYVIIGCVLVDALDSSENGFIYSNYVEFTDDANYQEFMKKLTERNYYVSPIDVNKDDKYITLSTCEYVFEEARMAIFARKLREGETKESLQELINATTQNTKKVNP